METLIVMATLSVGLTWIGWSGTRSRRDRYRGEGLAQQLKDRWAYWRARR